MSLKQLLTPEVIATIHSDFNGEIQLIEFMNSIKVEVAGLTQSGDVMVWIWSQAIKNLLPKNYSPESILLLGLGGGSATIWLRHHFPKSHITVVEIDPVMIGIAKKYFHVDKLKDVTIINQDAVEYIQKTKQEYSLILNDCYQGFKTPPGFDDIKVLKRMKEVGESVLINRLYWDEHKINTDKFFEKISHHFHIKSVYTSSNLVISLT